jgi:membrane protease YdiL (CAAX protease family)
MSTRVALTVALVIMVAVNVWVYVGSPRSQLVTGPLAALALVIVGRAAGLTWADLGLALDDLIPGAIYGGVAAGAVAIAYEVGIALPHTRGAFRDTRYRMRRRAALVVAVVTIPLATILFEEVAFRSVLWGLLLVEYGALVATAVTSALFGVWHVLPALKLARTNTALAGRGDPSGLRTLLTVLGTVAFTAVAGVLFAELRRRSGSVVAPMILHWATNGLGVLAAARVWSLGSGRTP